MSNPDAIKFFLRGLLVGYFVGSLGYITCILIYIVYYTANKLEFSAKSGEILAPLVNSVATRCLNLNQTVEPRHVEYVLSNMGYLLLVTEDKLVRYGSLLLDMSRLVSLQPIPSLPSPAPLLSLDSTPSKAEPISAPLLGLGSTPAGKSGLDVSPAPLLGLGSTPTSIFGDDADLQAFFDSLDNSSISSRKS